MAIRTFIDGMGVLGRRLLRMITSDEYPFDTGTNGEYKVVGINDPYVSVKQLAYLLTHDTVYGAPSDYTVEFQEEYTSEYDQITINGLNIPMYHKTDASELSLGDLATYQVFDCRGVVKTNAQAATAIDTYYRAGGRYVCIASEYPLSNYYNIVFGVNHTSSSKGQTGIISPLGDGIVASTLSLIANNMSGVENGIVKAVTAYDNSNTAEDSAFFGSDVNVSRALGWNIMPNITSSQRNYGFAVGFCVPELNSKVIGKKTSVPTIAGSLMEGFYVLTKATERTDIDTAMKTAQSNSGKTLTDIYASKGGMLIDYSSETIDIASSDAIGSLRAIYQYNRGDIIQGNEYPLAYIPAFYDNTTITAANMLLISAYNYQ